jgi:Zn-dependent protease/predicted transcriptional regulator
MRLWSLRIARIFGVDLRLHLFFVLLLGLLMSYASLMGVSGARGATLWLDLLLAVGVRELARALAMAALGLDLRAMLLLPTGGLPTYATVEATERAATPRAERILALAGPLANLLAGLVVAGYIASVAPELDLLHRPWIGPQHLLRALVWMQFALAGLHLLPASTLDCGRVIRASFDKAHGNLKGARAAAGLGQAVAGLLLVLGVFLPSIWLVIFGATILLAAPAEANAVLLRTDVETIRMRDVMLTDFVMLSASDTLEGALERVLHTVQDVFPVSRGPQLVGAISRQAIVDTLQADGNGYLQGAMTRTLQPAQPDDPLVLTLRRIAAGRAAQFVPVVEDGRVVGIVTPQNLSQAVGLYELRRRLQRNSEGRARGRD